MFRLAMFRLAFALVLLGLSASSQAGRPLQAEDAGVIEVRACEVEGMQANRRGGGADQRQRSLQLGCGIAPGWELALQALRPNELVLAGKVQLLAAPWRAGEAQVTLVWTLAHRRTEFDWDRSSLGLTLAASLPVTRDWTVHANLGHLRDELLSEDSLGWALAVEHAGLGEDGRWQPMAEVFGDDRHRPWVNAALRLVLQPGRLFVDSSAGRQLGGARARLTTFGFKWAF